MGFTQTGLEQFHSEFYVQILLKKTRNTRTLTQSDTDRILAFQTIYRTFLHANRRRCINEKVTLDLLNTYREEQNATLFMIRTINSV